MLFPSCLCQSVFPEKTTWEKEMEKTYLSVGFKIVSQKSGKLRLSDPLFEDDYWYFK